MFGFNTKCKMKMNRENEYARRNISADFPQGVLKMFCTVLRIYFRTFSRSLRG